MKIYEPDYASRFRCLAGACPDTCCKDWEIIIDDETLRKYRALPGAFGDEVRAALTTDEEGDTMFRLEDGHCPLVRADGLCRLQLAYGEEALCKTCRAHPRFWEEYGAAKELTLSISCPAAAQLLFTHDGPVTFTVREDGEPVSGSNDLDPELYLTLRNARQTAISIAQNRSLSIPDRLSLELLFADRLQTLLDDKKYARADGLLARFSAPERCKRELSRAKRLRAKKAAFFPCWLLLNNMEHLTVEFPRFLDGLPAREPAPSFDEAFCDAFEHLTVYFLWRWLLKASVDGKLLSRVESCVFHVLSIAALFSAQETKDLQTLARLSGLYSKEVEHSDENLRLLARVFERGTLKLSVLLRLLR